MQFTAGTGINPWWRYQAENAPGGGHIMINVGTGNLLLQDDDMNVPHNGVALALRRTYNSQSQHDVNGSDGSAPSMYGNGWTTTFDAHLSSSAPSITTVWDIDGAHYDYTLASDGVTWTPPIGQHATLTWDHGCGFLWTKKFGTAYYFWQAPNGPCGPSYGGLYAGKLYQIIGRNRNTFITFGYSWDIGTHTVGDKVSAISATTESGITANLVFGDVSGHRLLDHITFPDGMTSVSYGYDTLGNLTTVSRPPNNAAGTRPIQSFGYYNPGGMMAWVASPRWNASDNGSMFYISYDGAPSSTATLSAIAHVGTVNSVIPDGTGAVLQPGYATGAVEYEHEWFGTGGPAPWYHDTDGHLTYWVMDAQRPKQTQECTATTGWNCTGAWLVSNETWDQSTNNLTNEVDPRGNETDYLYDPMGNTTAVGEPYATTSVGSFKPTTLYDYDGFSNLIAYCDETASHANGGRGDWTNVGPPTAGGPDALCATNGSSAHAVFTYPINPAPVYEPFGRLTNIRSASGYNRTIAYSADHQAGADYGLPTSVTGDSFVQIDGSTIAPTQTLWYDATGNLRCYNNGQGTSVLSYDALGRMISEADPDDSSANTGSLCGKRSGLAGWNTQTIRTYFPDGALQSSQSPAQRSGGVSTMFTYDMDGNETTETHHYGCTAGNTCTAGVTTKSYDGANRLVEVQLPIDPSEAGGTPWFTRYLYDLSGGGTVSIAGTSFRAYGGLFKTQEWNLAPGATAASWVDLRGAAFDAIDRATTKYSFSPGSNTTLRATTMTYDAAGSVGLLSSMIDPLGETTIFAYDTMGRASSMQFSGDGGVTPNKSFVYDPNGRQVSVWGAVYGAETTAYDADGRVSEVDEPTAGNITSPAHTTYGYYPDGKRKNVNVVSSAISAAPLISYAYRVDGQRTLLRSSYGQTASFAWTYTDGGRPLVQTDPYTGTVMPNPQRPVAPGSAYLARSSTYDTTGQAAGLQMPETMAYSALTHDDEGHLASWAGTSSNGPGTSTMKFVNNVRGENLSQTLLPNSTARSASSYHGAMVTSKRQPQGQPLLNWQAVLDPINSVVLGSHYNVYMPYTNYEMEPPTTAYANCGVRTDLDTYDAASRKTDSTYSISGGSGDPNCAEVSNTSSAGDPTPYAFAYDAENHHIGARGAQWTPGGQAYYFGTSDAYVHYDGNVPLFFTDTTGALTQINLESVADINGGGLVSVWDRDISGLLKAGHNSGYYGAIDLGATTWPAARGQQPLQMTFLGSANSSNLPSLFLYKRLDGFDYSGLTFQGVRAMENSTGQWTTPDAYAGDVHDPMSQKAFMWNRNNPHAYSDPSGYYSGIPDASGQLSDFGTSSYWDDQNQGSAAASSQGGPVDCAHAVYPKWCRDLVAQDKLSRDMLSAIGIIIPGGKTADSIKLASKTTYLYQLVDKLGNHIKYGITSSPLVRYTEKELAGGRLKILTSGTREKMLELERAMHTHLPIGPGEGQSIYRAIQKALGLKVPPY